MSEGQEDARTELEIQRRVKQMRDEELVNFVRDTISRLNVLADRLETFAETEEERESRDA